MEIVKLEGPGKASRWLAKDGRVAVLLITKLPNTRTDTHPYKVFPMVREQVQAGTDPIFVYGSKSVKHAVAAALNEAEMSGWPRPNEAHRVLEVAA